MATTVEQVQLSGVSPEVVVPGKDATTVVEAEISPSTTEPEVETTTETEEEPELQNALTEKFTEAEWKALKEFRPHLPKIFAEAYHPDDLNATSAPIQLWGVTIDPEAPHNDAKVSVILMKFLRARELNVEAAHSMLAATLRWRDEFNVDEDVAEDFPKEVFGKVAYIRGKDKHGRPVTYNLYGGKNIKEVFSDVTRFTRWRVSFMEKSIRLLDFETQDQMIQIHDYAGASFFGRDSNQKAAASEATNIFQNHYPEFLARKFFINVPTLLSWIFWIFKPLISPKTLSKMSVVGSGKTTVAAALLPLISPEELPRRYGGDADDLE